MLRRLIAALAALVAMSIAASPAGAITFGHASGGASNTYDIAAVVLDRSPGLTPATLPHVGVLSQLKASGAIYFPREVRQERLPQVVSKSATRHLERSISPIVRSVICRPR
jgi:hypothetical protein